MCYFVKGDALELMHVLKQVATISDITRIIKNTQMETADSFTVREAVRKNNGTEFRTTPQFCFFSLRLFSELHANNAVDIGNKCGVAVKASAGGTVVKKLLKSTVQADGIMAMDYLYSLNTQMV